VLCDLFAFCVHTDKIERVYFSGKEILTKFLNSFIYTNLIKKSLPSITIATKFNV